MRMYQLEDGYWKIVHRNGRHFETKYFTLALLVMLKSQVNYKWTNLENLPKEHVI